MLFQLDALAARMWAGVVCANLPSTAQPKEQKMM